MGEYTCQCIRCKRCGVEIQWQSHIFLRRENRGWENIVMWDKGCCLPRALAFAIRINKEVMEVIGVSIEAT